MDLAKNALESIKVAGGSPELEKQIGSIASAMSGSSPVMVDNSHSSYSKVGGSGPQASIQTASNISTTPSEGSSTTNLAKKALESLGGGSSSSGGSTSSGTSSGESDSLKSLAKNALDSLGGSSGSK